MIEVYFIGLLLAMIKLYELSNVVILAGFYINILYILSVYILGMVFNPLLPDKQKYQKIDKNSLHKTVLFLCLALIFVYPAYSLPMMNFSKYGVLYATNIYEGINTFIKGGDTVVPVVIFVASFIIPALKIIGLSVMVLMARYGKLQNYQKFATKFYIVSDILGKYSLLDVFVVVLASSYIQYNNLVNIQPGEAFVPFILVVIFTMIASKSFDTRLLWYNGSNEKANKKK
jgi:paraquat-inducible protein A